MGVARERTREEIERILQRQIKKGARDVGAPVEASPELKRLQKSPALRQAAHAIDEATRANFQGDAVKPPSGWFPPFL
jgi:hypothetical protein